MYEVATMVEKNWHQIFHASIFIFLTCHFQYRTHCTDAVTRGGEVSEGTKLWTTYLGLGGEWGEVMEE